MAYTEAASDQDGGDTVQGAISEADLRAGLAQDGKVLDVVVVAARPPLLATTYFVPYLRLSWRPDEHVAVARYRGKGLRNYSDFRLLLDKLGEDFGYRGPILVLPEQDPKIAELGLFQPQ